MENHPASLPQKVIELFICHYVRDNAHSNLAGSVIHSSQKDTKVLNVLICFPGKAGSW